MNISQHSFDTCLSLVKEAAPKYIKFYKNIIKKNDFLSKAQAGKLKKIIKDAGAKERELAGLGHGDYQLSELVGTKGGKQVRKLELISEGYHPVSKDWIINKNQIKAGRLLRQITKGRGKFAHFIGNKGNALYYQHASGYPVTTRLWDPADLDKFSERALSKLKETFPKLSDVRRGNMVGDVLVDYNAAPKIKKELVPFTARNIAFTKRFYFDKSGKPFKWYEKIDQKARARAKKTLSPKAAPKVEARAKPETPMEKFERGLREISGV